MPDFTLADILGAQAGAPGPVYEGGPTGNVSLADVLGPSWLDRAQKQAQADSSAYQRGGVPELMADTGQTQDLAGGFGGTTKSVGPGIRAYHASPYDFDKFDLSKIGTGQGAQSYGHGLYAAESPAVSGPKGSYDFEFTAKNMGKYDLNQAEGLVLRSIRDGKSDLGIMTDLLNNRVLSSSPFDAEMKAAQEMIDRVRSNKATIYDLNINAKPEQFLDWDKPLSQQDPSVRSAYEKIFGAPDPKLAELRVRETNELMDALAADRDPVTNAMRSEPEWFKLARERDKAWKEWERSQSGQKVYDALAGASAIRQSPAWEGVAPNINRQAAASELLQKEGIPGIRYLDQFSRPQYGSVSGARLNPGPETYNYVLNNPALIDILKKYGLAGMLGGPTMAGVLQAQSEPPP